MSAILRVLHVGVSNRGEWPLKRCDESTGFRPAALCDVTEDALKTARDLTGLPQSACFTNLDEALAEADVDCVIVCTPTMFHVPMACKAIDAKLPVLVEKGMAPDWKSACDLVEAAKAKSAVVAVAQNYRYQNVERTIHRAIRDQSWEFHVGDVHLLTYAQQRVRPIPRTLNYPFASVWDMSCHHFDNMLFWLGAMTEMTAHAWRAGWSPYVHPANTSAHILFGNDAHVHYIHTHDAARTSLEIQVHGSKGALFLQNGNLTFNDRPFEQFGSRPIREVPLENTDAAGDLLRDFHLYATQGREPAISARNNLETMAACEMMVRSVNDSRACRRDSLQDSIQSRK
jgi:predicted dehydrogenase